MKRNRLLVGANLGVALYFAALGARSWPTLIVGAPVGAVALWLAVSLTYWTGKTDAQREVLEDLRAERLRDG